MSGKLDFEFVTMSGKKALAELLDMREDLPESNSYPFLMGDDESFELIEENYDFNKEISVAEIIAKSQMINPLELFEQEKKDSIPSNDAEFVEPELVGEWQHLYSNGDIGLPWEDSVMSHHDLLTKIPFEKCFLGIAPTVDSWKVPAYIRFGDWNRCPKPEEHCAVFRYWQEKYRAEIVSLTHDVIECCVANPPQTEAECWELAWQQYAYCPDIVKQGVETIGNLASSLRDSTYWYFWWD